jgi:hypothetical protein
MTNKMKIIKLKNKILQQLYRPQVKKSAGGKKNVDELEKAIDNLTKKIFNKKTDSKNQN